MKIKDMLELENKLNTVLNEKNVDAQKLKALMEDVKRQIQLMDIKENTLKRVRSKYNDILSQFETLYNGEKKNEES